MHSNDVLSTCADSLLPLFHKNGIIKRKTHIALGKFQLSLF